MKFFSSVYNSLFNIAWLKERRKSAGHAWGYFFLLMLIVSAFYTIPMMVVLPGGLRQATETVQTSIPDNFKAQVKNGELTISGVIQPIIFRDPKNNDFVVIVDTTSTSSLSLSTYLREGDRGGVLITKEKIETYNPPRSQIVYMREIADIEVKKADIINVANWFASPTVITIFSLILVIIILIGIVIWKLWAVLFATLGALIISALFRRGWKFGELFTMALYAITLPTIVSFALFAVSISVPWLHFIILLSFMMAVVLTKSLVDSAVTPSNEERPPTPSLS